MDRAESIRASVRVNNIDVGRARIRVALRPAAAIPSAWIADLSAAAPFRSAVAQIAAVMAHESVACLSLGLLGSVGPELFISLERMQATRLAERVHQWQTIVNNDLRVSRELLPAAVAGRSARVSSPATSFSR